MVNHEIDEIKKQFLILIKRFMNNDILVDSFCSETTQLWIRYRDIEEDIRKTWDESYDQKLIEACLEGSLSPEDFEKQYRELWGLNEKNDFFELLNGTHSACSVFSPSLMYDWEINEHQLRREIKTLSTAFMNE
jgi:hypothetical protein